MMTGEANRQTMLQQNDIYIQHKAAQKIRLKFMIFKNNSV